MSKSALFWQVYQRLVDEPELDSLTQRLVEAAFADDAAIREALDAPPEQLGAESSVADDANAAPPEVYLERLDVTGFRGVGVHTTLTFETCPGLTVVVGRNGSGKSSFAEALEVLLTGESLRWKDRKQKEWLSGWKNLHHDGRTWIRGTFLAAGTGKSVQIQRSWDADEYDDGALELDGKSVPTLENWTEALETFRPVLSYNEIGSALDGGPSHLYDLLRGVLGMEELTRAGDRLAYRRKQLVDVDKQQKASRDSVVKALGSSEDPRAERARAALKGRNADLDELLELLVDEDTGDAEVSVLRRVASLELPNATDVLSAAQALRDGADAVAHADAQTGELEAETVRLLKAAMVFHDHTPDRACPVCGTDDALTDTWRTKANAQVAGLEASTQARGDAKRAVEAATRTATSMLSRVSKPPAVKLAEFAAAEAAYTTWTTAPHTAPALAEHLEKSFDALEKSYDALREAAKRELALLQAEWRPIRRSIEAFVEAAEAWDKAKPGVKALKAAEGWLSDADVTLRNERFIPIRDQSQAIWEKLRHRSNVSLNDIRLEGSKTRRRVELDVAVDGKSAVALGVMSQGELHALLLSLFLPRLTLPESPFRFLVVDDPVQAMDPAKVDGLAQVLSDVAEHRQVVVFTHDARLPEALRRMQIPARIVEVTRAENSAVTLRDTRSRPAQFLADAWQVADDQSEFSPRVAPNIVPGLCRGAVESHLQSTAWRVLLKSGHEHDDIEKQIEEAKTVHTLAALAFFGDSAKSGDVYGYLNNKLEGGTTTFKALKDGAHGAFQGDVRILIKDTQRLLRAIGAAV